MPPNQQHFISAANDHSGSHLKSNFTSFSASRQSSPVPTIAVVEPSDDETDVEVLAKEIEILRREHEPNLKKRIAKAAIDAIHRYATSQARTMDAKFEADMDMRRSLLELSGDKLDVVSATVSAQGRAVGYTTLQEEADILIQEFLEVDAKLQSMNDRKARMIREEGDARRARETAQQQKDAHQYARK